MKRSSQALYRLLGSKYALEILEELRSAPKRFTDLKKLIRNESILSKKLKGLKQQGLLSHTIIEKNGRKTVGYTITEKTEEILKREP